MGYLHARRYDRSSTLPASERILLVELLKAHRVAATAVFLRERVHDTIAGIDIPGPLVARILHRWVARGWYAPAEALDRGQLTPRGLEIARAEELVVRFGGTG